MEKYHSSSVIQDFVFSSRKSGCFRCILLQAYNKSQYICDSFVFSCTPDWDFCTYCQYEKMLSHIVPHTHTSQKDRKQRAPYFYNFN